MTSSGRPPEVDEWAWRATPRELEELAREASMPPWPEKKRPGESSLERAAGWLWLGALVFFCTTALIDGLPAFLAGR